MVLLTSYIAGIRHVIAKIYSWRTDVSWFCHWQFISYSIQMRAVFFLKVNGKTKKVKEEEMPDNFDPKSVTVMGLVALNNTPQFVAFKRIDAPGIDDTSMFMFDADTYEYPKLST